MKHLGQRFLIVLGAAILLLAVAPTVHAMPYDIQGHWAAEAIRNLVQSQILNGYPDGSFKPDQSVTRAEFCKIIAKAYNLKPASPVPFPDVKKHWAKDYISALTAKKIINGYPDGSFQPDRPITRAEIAAMLSRLLDRGITEVKFTMETEPSFPDVKPDFWAFRYTEIINRLGVFPGYYQPEFRPERLVSRADTAWMVESLRKLKVIKGKVTDNGDGSGLLTIRTDAGQAENFALDPETIIFRNNLTTTPDKIQRDDQITLYADASGSCRFALAYGQVTKDDLLGRISATTDGKISPDQVNALLNGDWNSLKEDAKSGLYDKLLALGLSPAEAEGILGQDWQYLDTLSRDRLAEALSGYLGITKDLSHAILDRDVPRIKQYTKIEVATALLNKLMQKSAFAPSDNQSF